MIRVNVKPLSVNRAWLGRRRKSKEYRLYEEFLHKNLPTKAAIPKRGKLVAYYRAGFSNAGNDWDNFIKPFQDILGKQYGFNDNRIQFAIVEKCAVPKGEEFLEFSFAKYSNKKMQEVIDTYKEVFNVEDI